jgi:hypothetical protein
MGAYGYHLRVCVIEACANLNVQTYGYHQMILDASSPCVWLLESGMMDAQFTRTRDDDMSGA